MLLSLAQVDAGARQGYAVQFARCMSDVIEAQRLRYQVFGEAMGARLAATESGVDRDIFDPFCEHLLVRDCANSEVVATCRILSSAQAKKLGGFYSDNGFDLVRLRHLRRNIVEIGRFCVHPGHQNRAAFAALWSGLTQYLRKDECEYAIGCVSISMADGGHVAASIYHKLQHEYLSSVEYRVFPRYPLPLGALNSNLDLSLPPLIAGFLRSGAYVCGEPDWNPDFNTADLLLLLPTASMVENHAGRLMQAA